MFGSARVTSSLVISPAGRTSSEVTRFGSTSLFLILAPASLTFSSREASALSAWTASGLRRITWRTFHDRARTLPPSHHVPKVKLFQPASAVAVNQLLAAATVTAECRRRWTPVVLPAHAVAAVRPTDPRVRPTAYPGEPWAGTHARVPATPVAPAVIHGGV